MVEFVKNFEQEIRNISDARIWGDLYIVRDKSRLLAISNSDYSISWSVIIEGESNLVLDDVFITDDISGAFALDREKDICRIYGVDRLGSTQWVLESPYRPLSVESIVAEGSSLYYIGVNDSSDDSHLIKVNLEKGKAEEIYVFSRHLRFLSKKETLLVLAGQDGFGVYSESKEAFSLINTTPVESTVQNSKNQQFIVESESENIFEINSINSESNYLQSIGSITLDTSNRTSLFPATINDRVFAIRQDGDGVCAKKLESEEIEWSLGEGEWSVLQIRTTSKHLVVSYDDDEFNSYFKLISPDGNQVEIINYVGASSTMHVLEDDTILIGGLSGLQIFKV